jgi:two-component SAPR family response regulator
LHPDLRLLGLISYAQNTAAVTGQNARETARILSLYRAPFLNAEPFEWAGEFARDAEEAYERLSLGLADYNAASGSPDEAEGILCALLSHVSLCTEAYRKLLDIYMETGNRTAFLTRYGEYNRVLKAELHLKPAEKYRMHYKTLL